MKWQELYLENNFYNFKKFISKEYNMENKDKIKIYNEILDIIESKNELKNKVGGGPKFTNNIVYLNDVEVISTYTHNKNINSRLQLFSNNKTNIGDIAKKSFQRINKNRIK